MINNYRKHNKSMRYDFLSEDTIKDYDDIKLIKVYKSKSKKYNNSLVANNYRAARCLKIDLSNLKNEIVNRGLKTE